MPKVEKTEEFHEDYQNRSQVLLNHARPKRPKRDWILRRAKLPVIVQARKVR